MVSSMTDPPAALAPPDASLERRLSVRICDELATRALAVNERLPANRAVWERRSVRTNSSIASTIRAAEKKSSSGNRSEPMTATPMPHRTVVANLLLRRSGHLLTYCHRTKNPERLIDDCRQAVALVHNSGQL